MISGVDLKNRFVPHSLNQEQQDASAAVTHAAYQFALLLMANVPDCREKALAMTKLEECSSWAIAAIARTAPAVEADGG